MAAGAANEVRSGDFVGGGFDVYPETWLAGGGKLWWIPHKLSMTGPVPTLVVRAAALDRTQEVKVFQFRSVARAVGPDVPAFVPPSARLPRLGRWQGNGTFYPSTVRLPRPGRWMLVVTAGTNWGCFILAF